MTKIPFELFLQSTIYPLKINVGWIFKSLGSNWIHFGNLSLQDKNIGANSIFKASDAECVKILFASVFGWHGI